MVVLRSVTNGRHPRTVIRRVACYEFFCVPRRGEERTYRGAVQREPFVGLFRGSNQYRAKLHPGDLLRDYQRLILRRVPGRRFSGCNTAPLVSRSGTRQECTLSGALSIVRAKIKANPRGADGTKTISAGNANNYRRVTTSLRQSQRVTHSEATCGLILFHRYASNAVGMGNPSEVKLPCPKGRVIPCLDQSLLFHLRGEVGSSYPSPICLPVTKRGAPVHFHKATVHCRCHFHRRAGRVCLIVSLFLLPRFKVSLRTNHSGRHRRTASRRPPRRVLMARLFLRPTNHRSEGRRTRDRGDHASHVVYHLVFSIKVVGRVRRVNHGTGTMSGLFSGCTGISCPRVVERHATRVGGSDIEGKGYRHRQPSPFLRSSYQNNSASRCSTRYRASHASHPMRRSSFDHQGPRTARFTKVSRREHCRFDRLNFQGAMRRRGRSHSGNLFLFRGENRDHRGLFWSYKEDRHDQ